MFEDFKGIPIEAKYLILASFLPAVAFGTFYVDLSYFLTTIQGLSDVFMGSVIMVMGVSMVLTLSSTEVGRFLLLGCSLVGCSSPF